MWIAKPLEALSEKERAAWVSMRPSENSLSQTLAWGEAIQAVGGRAYVIFNPEEKVGGLVHSLRSFGGTASAMDHFECVNGPFLHWDDPKNIARQFATFVMAVTRLSSRFSSLRIQPRWPDKTLVSRLALLPIEPQEISRASTLHVPVKVTEAEQLSNVSARLRRSVSIARRSQVATSICPADREGVREFCAGMRKFGSEKGFYVPEESWFQGLVFGEAKSQREDLKFWIAESTAAQNLTRLLICVHGGTAHYLFGYDVRSDQSPSSLSTAAAAHFSVLQQCSKNGVSAYDLNGFTDPDDGSHPYAGVSRFKAQFQGAPIHFVSPLFQIET